MVLVPGFGLFVFLGVWGCSLCLEPGALSVAIMVTGVKVNGYVKVAPNHTHLALKPTKIQSVESS